MNGFIGFNPEKINELMQLIADSYQSIGEKMASGWNNVSSTMQSNWKGLDEQDYEDKLAKRMNSLYGSSTSLVNAMIQQIKNLADSWKDFQARNILQGGDNATMSARPVAYEFSIPALKVYDMWTIVKLNENSFAGENLGLVSGGGNVIKLTVDNYVNQIKNDISSMYAQFDSSSAFLGSQSQEVNNYLQAVSRVIQAVATDISDMYTAIDKLTTTGYADADATVTSEMHQAANLADEVPEVQVQQ